MATPSAPGTISPAIVGHATAPVTHAIDARWLMAYAAGLGETDPRYFDTRAAGGPVAHPLFPVCYEWPAAVAMRRETIDDRLAPLGVHATHHLALHRLPRAGDRLTTTATVTAVEPRRSGTLVTARYVTLDGEGRAVTTTQYGSLYRGVRLGDDDIAPARPAAAPAPVADWTDTMEVTAGAAHVYTECARIWNPIHTDLDVATRAGLPALILHGTATLALAVSRVLARELDGDPARVAEVSARFSGMVLMPSRITVRAGRREGQIRFDAVNERGEPVLAQGVLRPCSR